MEWIGAAVVVIGLVCLAEPMQDARLRGDPVPSRGIAAALCAVGLAVVAGGWLL
jgi:hypothetical protein